MLWLFCLRKYSNLLLLKITTTSEITCFYTAKLLKLLFLNLSFSVFDELVDDVFIKVFPLFFSVLRVLTMPLSLCQVVIRCSIRNAITAWRAAIGLFYNRICPSFRKCLFMFCHFSFLLCFLRLIRKYKPVVDWASVSIQTHIFILFLKVVAILVPGQDRIIILLIQRKCIAALVPSTKHLPRRIKVRVST